MKILRLDRFSAALLLVLACVAGITQAEPIDVAQGNRVDWSTVDPADHTYEHWYLDTIGDQAIGYWRSSLSVQDDTIVSTYHEHRVESHGGEKSTYSNRVVWTETKDFKPLHVVITTSAGSDEVIKTYRFVEGGIELTSEQTGRTIKRKLPPIKGEYLTAAQASIAIDLSLANGDDKLSYPALDFSVGLSPFLTTMQRSDAEAATLTLADGSKTQARLWVTTYSAFPGFELRNWIDEEHTIVGVAYDIDDMTFESRLSNESVAELAFDPPEMSGLSVVVPDKPINDLDRQKKIVYELHYESGDSDIIPVQAANQTVERLGKGKARVTVDLGSKPRTAQDDKPTEEHLASSMMIDHEDELVRKLAKHAAAKLDKDASTEQIATACKRFVTRHINGASLSVGDGSASEAARTREGDCTECSVLLAALLRAHGIPSRCVVGLVYCEDDFVGQSDVFVYHQWTQAWIETDENRGYWLDLDSAMWRYSAGHIALGVSAMGDESQEELLRDKQLIESYEAWFVLNIGGEKAGHMHVTLKQDGDKIVNSSAMKIAIKRGQAEMTIEQSSSFVETLDHQPIKATSSMALGAMATQQVLDFTGETWKLTTTTAGNTSTIDVDQPKADWLTPGALSVFMEAAIERGDEEVSVSMLDLSTGVKPISITMKRGDRADIEVFGKIVPATKWVTTMSAMPGLEIEQWSDETGQPVKQMIPLMPGMEMEMLLADKALALAEFDAPEMLAASLIKPDKVIKKPRTLKRAVFDLVAEDLKNNVGDTIPNAGFQRTEWIDGNTLRVTVDLERQVVDKTLLKEERAQYLPATSMLNYEDTAIQKLITGIKKKMLDHPGALTPDALYGFMQEAQQIARNHIEAKDLSVGFASASEVARTGQGDCTEHACLLAAMVRGLGMPARTVTGIVYADQFAGERDIFGFHMWTQVCIHVDGGGHRWVDLDAALPGQVDGFDATHIALSTSALKDGESFNDMVTLLPLMQGMEIKVVETAWAD
eukprot:g12056.t1